MNFEAITKTIQNIPKFISSIQQDTWKVLGKVAAAAISCVGAGLAAFYAKRLYMQKVFEAAHKSEQIRELPEQTTKLIQILRPTATPSRKETQEQLIAEDQNGQEMEDVASDDSENSSLWIKLTPEEYKEVIDHMTSLQYRNIISLDQNPND